MANKDHPIHQDNRKDLQDYIAAMRVLKPREPDPKDRHYVENMKDYRERLKAWQTLLNVGKRWHILRNQEDFPESSHLFDELGKAKNRTRK